MPQRHGSKPGNLLLNPGQALRVNAEDTGWEAFTPAGGPHTHPESDVVNLVTDLSGKAPSADGVTNGNSHDHSGGDGAAIDHANLTNVLAAQHHTNANDPNVDQKAALAGTSGTPSVTNKYVTDADPRNINARAPTSHSHPESEVTNLVTDLAGKEPANSNIQAHISSTSNPHSTTAAQVSALATTAFVGLSKITVSSGAPGTPSVGDLWIQT